MPATPARPLRLVVFGPSITADWGNPAATTWRALLQALTRDGHEAVYLEPRHNPHAVGLLRARGSAGLRGFAAGFPGVRYRTYDLPAGMQRSVWFGRELGTMDAAVALDTAPPGILGELAGYETSRFVRILHLTGEAEHPLAGRFDLVARPGTGGASGEAGATLGPAVMPGGPGPARGRDGIVVVAYDNETLAAEVAPVVDARPPRLVSAGAVDLPGWDIVPEVELPARYRSAALAVVVGEPLGGLAAARAALPLAHGCPFLAVTSHVEPAALPELAPFATTVEALPERIAAALAGAPSAPPVLPDTLAATTQARWLAATATRLLTAQRR